MPTISGINIYPIKSCRGIEVQEVLLTTAGLNYDRQWAVVKAESGRFLTQRQIAKMALIVPALPSGALLGHTPVADAVLAVNAPGMAELRVPLNPQGDAHTRVRTATVWEWTGTAADEGDEAADWFSRYLGVPCRLVKYMGSEASRVSPKLHIEMAHKADLPLTRFTDEKYAIEYETRFTDGFPMLIASEGDLADLNKHLAPAPPVPMNRFRPNLVMAEAEPWVEDGWRSLVLQGREGPALALTVVKPCSRCKVPTIDQMTAEMGDEPTETLQKLRSGKVLGWSAVDKSWTHCVFFGWNAVSRSTGVVRVGDSVEVVATQDRSLVHMTPAA